MNSCGKIVSNKFFAAVLEFPENIDIDEEWQFKFACKLLKDYIY